MRKLAVAEGLAADRRKEPEDDIVSTLLHAEVDGERLSDLEFNLFFLLLSVAGNETTRNAISHGMHALMENPGEYKRLVDDPSLIDSAVEEILRWSTPVMNFRRTTTTDTVIRDIEIPAGEAVVFWHMSANRDEDAFDHPFTFDITRDPNLHTTIFLTTLIRCVGCDRPCVGIAGSSDSTCRDAAFCQGCDAGRGTGV